MKSKVVLASLSESRGKCSMRKTEVRRSRAHMHSEFTNDLLSSDIFIKAQSRVLFLINSRRNSALVIMVLAAAVV